MPSECIFCSIASGQIKSDILYRDQRCFVIRDMHPKAPVHLLIIPAQHFTYLTYLTDAFEPLVGHLFTVAEEMAKREGIANKGYRLVVNQGPDSGQEVAHLHLHLLAGSRLGAMG